MTTLLQALVDLKRQERDGDHLELEIFDGTLEDLAEWIEPAVQKLVLAERERCAEIAHLHAESANLARPSMVQQGDEAENDGWRVACEIIEKRIRSAK